MAYHACVYPDTRYTAIDGPCMGDVDDLIGNTHQ